MTQAILVPGAAGAVAFWTPLVERLPAEWSVRAIDLPGLGEVAARADVSSYDDLVAHVARTITVPSVVVAQSMGAFIALQLALQHPQLVTHLVLVAATSGIDVASHGGADWREEYSSVYPRAQAWARAPLPDLSGQLGDIRVPVLLIWPTHDVLSPLSVAEALRSGMPLASLITFASNNHWIVHQFADQCARAIQSFIEA